MNRCLNDHFAYCDTTPDTSTTGRTRDGFSYKGEFSTEHAPTPYCKLDGKSCGHLVLFTDTCKFQEVLSKKKA